MSHSRKYSINELAQHANVSRRTVRYYVQRGLLAPPNGKGRGSYYTATHLKHLLYIRDQQLKGVSLEHIHVEHSSSSPELGSNKKVKTLLDSIAIASNGGGRPVQARRFKESSSIDQSSTSQWTHVAINSNLQINFKTHYLDSTQTLELCQLIQNFIQKQSGECE